MGDFSSSYELHGMCIPRTPNIHLQWKLQLIIKLNEQVKSAKKYSHFRLLFYY